MYGSLLSFALTPTPAVCFARAQGTALAYALVFSVLLSRSLMLATADTDGLPGHISGAVQLALFLALASVQVALGVQEWLVRSSPLTVTRMVGHSQVRELFKCMRCVVALIFGEFQETSCADVGLPFLARLTYPMVLLLLQVVVSPFILSSRRNYHEGLLFCLV